MEKKPTRKRVAKEPVGLELARVEPKTKNQGAAFSAYSSGQNLLLSGMAGTGKTYAALYLGLKDVEDRLFEKVIIVRSIVPSRDPGFLPGKLWEKTEVYEAPYQAMATDLYDNPKAYDVLKSRGSIEFMTTSFVRGITLTDCVLIMDEVQNMRWGEISSIITRVGPNCRLICVGDYRQTDLTRDDEKRGIRDLFRVVQKMPSFSHVEFTYDDILRSGLVREFLLARDQLNIQD